MVQVGDEVLLKARVTEIRERSKRGYYITVVIPDWFWPDVEHEIYITSDQNLLFKIKKES